MVSVSGKALAAGPKSSGLKPLVQRTAFSSGGVLSFDPEKTEQPSRSFREIGQRPTFFLAIRVRFGEDAFAGETLVTKNRGAPQCRILSL
jgi:hypothetical protein